MDGWHWYHSAWCICADFPPLFLGHLGFETRIFEGAVGAATRRGVHNQLSRCPHVHAGPALSTPPLDAHPRVGPVSTGRRQRRPIPLSLVPAVHYRDMETRWSLK